MTAKWEEVNRREVGVHVSREGFWVVYEVDEKTTTGGGLDFRTRRVLGPPLYRNDPTAPHLIRWLDVAALAVDELRAEARAKEAAPNKRRKRR